MSHDEPILSTSSQHDSELATSNTMRISSPTGNVHFTQTAQQVAAAALCSRQMSQSTDKVDSLLLSVTEQKQSPESQRCSVELKTRTGPSTTFNLFRHPSA